MDITRSRSVSSSSVSHRASSCSRSPPQGRRITPQLQLFVEEEARLAVEGHKVTQQVKVVLGRLLSKGYKRERQRKASKPHISSVTEKEVVNEHHEEIHPELEKSKTDVITTPFKEKGGKGGVSEREMAKKQEERKPSPVMVSENNVHVEERACAAMGSDLRVHIKMNKGKSHSSTTTKSPTNDGGKAGALFAAESLEEYAEFSRDNEDDGDSENEDLKKENEQLKMKYNKESSTRKQLYDEVIESSKGIL